MNNNGLLHDKLDFKDIVFSGRRRDVFTVIADKLMFPLELWGTRFNKLIEDGTVNIIGRVDQTKLGFVVTHISLYLCACNMIKKVAQKIARLPEVSFWPWPPGITTWKLMLCARQQSPGWLCEMTSTKIEIVHQTKTTITLKYTNILNQI